MVVKEVLLMGIEKLKKANIAEPILKAKILLAFSINKNKEYLVSHDNEELIESIVSKYMKYITRLANYEPLQYIIGKQEFMKLDFFVNNSVLIPRQDTEILVEEVLNLCSKTKDITILDLCTGSGAIAISISKNIPQVSILASDISEEALKVAKINNSNLNTNVNFIESDLFNNINQKFNIIVSNPPYIETETINHLDKEVQEEPKIALDGGKDGLDIYRKIIDNAYNYLTDEGYLCLEIGYNQKEAVTELIKRTNKYEQIYTKQDLSGKDRIVICKKVV